MTRRRDGASGIGRGGLAARATDGPDRFARLPEPTSPEDLVTTCDVAPVPDPDLGRDPERDWLVRYGSA